MRVQLLVGRRVDVLSSSSSCRCFLCIWSQAKRDCVSGRVPSIAQQRLETKAGVSSGDLQTSMTALIPLIRRLRRMLGGPRISWKTPPPLLTTSGSFSAESRRFEARRPAAPSTGGYAFRRRQEGERSFLSPGCCSYAPCSARSTPPCLALLLLHQSTSSSLPSLPTAFCLALLLASSFLCHKHTLDPKASLSGSGSCSEDFTGNQAAEKESEDHSFKRTGFN